MQCTSGHGWRGISSRNLPIGTFDQCGEQLDSPVRVKLLPSVTLPHKIPILTRPSGKRNSTANHCAIPQRPLTSPTGRIHDRIRTSHPMGLVARRVAEIMNHHRGRNCLGETTMTAQVQPATGDDSLAAPVRGLLAGRDGWQLLARGPWWLVLPPAHRSREQGWKLHVSATVSDAVAPCLSQWSKSSASARADE